MSPTNRKDGSTLDRLVSTARRNPEAVLLLAAGAALLLRGVNAAADALRHAGPETDEDAPRGAARNARTLAADMAGRVTRSAEDMAGQVSRSAEEMAGRVSHSVEEMAGYAGGVARGAVDRTSRVASETGSTLKGAMDRILDEQPLAVALFGIAAGAVFASAFPATSVEKGTLAPLGRRLHDTADEAGARVKRSAKRAGRRMKEVADEHGLNAEGLRDAARQVGEAVGDELATPSRRKPGRRRKVAAVVEQPDPLTGDRPGPATGNGEVETGSNGQRAA